MQNSFRFRQNWDLQGPGEGGGQAVRGLQLFRRNRLSRDGKVPQGAGTIRSMGKLAIKLKWWNNQLSKRFLEGVTQSGAWVILL